MSACAHRLEDGCSFVPCSIACVGGCACRIEVEADEANDQEEAVEA